MMIKWNPSIERFSIEDITEDEYAVIQTSLYFSYERAGNERVFNILEKLNSCLDELKNKPGF